jgi:hypothetical protein
VPYFEGVWSVNYIRQVLGFGATAIFVKKMPKNGKPPARSHV